MDNVFHSDKVLPYTQYSSIHIGFVIIIVCISCLLLQLPFLFNSNSPASNNQLILILFHLLLLFGALHFSRIKQQKPANNTLLSVFVSYVTCTDINFGYQTDMHYFYLLGLFVIPVLFFNYSRFKIISCMAIFIFLYSLAESRLLLILMELPTAKLDIDTFHFQRRNNHIFLIAACFAVAYALYSGLRANWLCITRQQSELTQLLNNILPEPVTKRLYQGEKAIADEIPHCTIVFADLVGFTQFSQDVSPDRLVTVLNELFCQLDQLCGHFRLEKIKTMGDQYMAVSGAPSNTPHHAIDACRFALAMRKVFFQWRDTNDLPIGIRIGIHSGSAIAGVIGNSKFSYDLWGADVNFASRMESHGLKNCIQVSESTYHLVYRRFYFKKRDSVNVKSIGNCSTYLLQRLKDVKPNIN